MNRDGLAATHSAQLRLAKICSNPDVVERNDGEELFARLHTLTYLNGLAANDSRGGRDDMGIAQLEPGPIKRGPSALHPNLGPAPLPSSRGNCPPRRDYRPPHRLAPH